jgi:hypothetical protein
MEYKPLDPDKNEIRLLRFLPSSEGGERPDLICCEMKHVSLNDCTPQYRLHTEAHKFSLASSKEIHSLWKEQHDVNLEKRQNGAKSATKRLGTLQNLKSRFSIKLGRQFRSQREGLDSTITPRFRWGDYMALSYTWGDLSRTETIFVNGCAVQVTENLAKVLHELKRDPSLVRGLGLWVDALCINQADLVERALQVKRMKDIYTQAWDVVAWLGEPDDQSDMAIEVFHNVHHGLSTDEKGLVEMLSQNPSFFGVNGWQAVYEFFGKEYWYRAWIIQELTMASDETQLVCGRQKMKWTTLGEVVDFLLLSTDVLAGSTDDHLQLREFLSRLKRVQKLRRLSNGEEQYPGNASLTEMVHLSHTSHATDQKDKIYGLLGLMHTNLAEMVKIDYTLDVSTVYRDFARGMIRWTGSLNHIYRGSRSSGRVRDPELPSWAYDFRTDIDREYLDNEVAFGACLGGYAMVDYSDDGLHLSCGGVCIDVVTHIDIPYGESVLSVQHLPGDHARRSSNSHPSVADNIPPLLPNALWRTLCFDARKYLTDPPNNPKLHTTLLGIPWTLDELAINASMDEIQALGWDDIYHSEYFAPFDRFRRSNQAFLIGKDGLTFKDFFQDTLYPISIDDASLILQALKRSMTALQGRSLMGTYLGFLGLGVRDARPRDEIWILMGCNMPVLLRQNGKGQHEVVGEVYYHGWMYGGVFDFMKTMRIEPQDVTLC